MTPDFTPFNTYTLKRREDVRLPVCCLNMRSLSNWDGVADLARDE